MLDKVGRALQAADFADASDIFAVPLDAELERFIGIIAVGIHLKFWGRHFILLVMNLFQWVKMQFT
jgi:hypothetical protein